jgi:protein TonB
VLDKSALEAVKTWKFEPGRKIGKPTIMWVDVPVKFVLKDTEPT